MIINPGDIIVGDEDGLVVVPQEQADYILSLAKKQQKAEGAIMKSIVEGTVDRSWIDQMLEQKGCEFK
jgi:regulator of RNase E activity RraA